ncbi:hypothetical protein BU26DRAFT_139132 [Trematosphaeria pertusa]|uniref:Uncharacterized protein n=1 Tax=Trematosphaeria pertusa TaxID=390896 RepID=A0A6A6IVR6_9PLEO|nr:uncharacterized protein BU26DRAFT_139132 [Trematosphaeria pertusa]KAF2254466.1 hypothetical protein BU26DRAFT_139132 [Trematosphaeria pertusa]
MTWRGSKARYEISAGCPKLLTAPASRGDKSHQNKSDVESSLASIAEHCLRSRADDSRRSTGELGSIPKRFTELTRAALMQVQWRAGEINAEDGRFGYPLAGYGCNWAWFCAR